MAGKQNLKKLLRTGAELLRSEGAEKVYVFGSVADDTARKDSDVDIAISGLPPERFFRVMAMLARLFRRPIDLVDLDDDTLFTRFLQDEGLLKRVA